MPCKIPYHYECGCTLGLPEVHYNPGASARCSADGAWWGQDLTRAAQEADIEAPDKITAKNYWPGCYGCQDLCLHGGAS